MMNRQQLEDRASLIFDRPGFSAPAHSKGGRIAFLDDRSGVNQVSAVNSPRSKPVRLTTYPERVQSMLTNASGRIVFGMDVGGNERQQIWTIEDGDSSARRLTNAHESIHEPGCLTSDGSVLMMRSNARDEAQFDIIALDLNNGQQTVWLKDGGQSMPVAVRDSGSQCLVIRNNGNLDSDLLLLTRNDEDVRVLTRHEGEAWIVSAEFHPTDKSIWFLTNEGEEFVRLERLDQQTGDRTVILRSAWDVHTFAISSLGTRVAIAINENGWSNVGVMDALPGAEPQWLDLPRGTVDQFSWSTEKATLAFGMSTATLPSRIYVVDQNSNVSEISAIDPDKSPPPVVEPELVHFPTFDGRSIPAFLFRPTGDGPFPVLVEIHGGPEGQRHLQYSSAVPTDQLIQSVGIAVLSLNVRGSIGYGKTYTHLDDKALRMDAVKDVSAAVDWLRTRDDIIPDRIGVMGQSYGGFMTLSSIVTYPGLWSAAVDVVGIANFVTFLERTGPWRRRHRSEEYGFLDHDREMLVQISPIHGVDRITAPLHIIHGRNDPRVPLFEAEQMTAALEQRGHPVSLRVFDDEGHGLSKLPNRVKGYAEATEFLITYLL